MSDNIYNASFAVSPREVAAVKLGVGRNGHEIILRSGERLPVSFGYAVKMFDRFHDRLLPRGWKVSKSKPRKRK